ncbi:MAG: GNAT family N-acetyltransferase [Nitrososphaerales archaeon]
MSQQILLKKASKDDWKRILDLYSSLDEEDLEFRFFNVHRLSSSEATLMADQPDHITLLALQGEAAIGEATLQSNGEVSVVVAKKSRGMGVATLLVNELIQIAGDAGYKRLKFYTLPTNRNMVGLGRAFGFRVLNHCNTEEEWVLDL